jgi:hypothetical protein
MSAEKLLKHEIIMKKQIIPSIIKEMKRFDYKLHLPIDYIIEQQYKKSRDKKFKDVLYLMCLWDYMHEKWQCTWYGRKTYKYGVVMIKCGTVKYKMLVNYASIYNVKSKATSVAKHIESLGIPTNAVKNVLSVYSKIKKLQSIHKNNNIKKRKKTMANVRKPSVNGGNVNGSCKTKRTRKKRKIVIEVDNDHAFVVLGTRQGIETLEKGSVPSNNFFFNISTFLEQFHIPPSHGRNYVNYNDYEKSNALCTPMAQFLASWSGKPDQIYDIRLQYILELLNHFKYPMSVGPLRNMVRGILDSYRMKFVQVRELSQKFGICSSRYKYYVNVPKGKELKEVIKYYDKRKEEDSAVCILCDNVGFTLGGINCAYNEYVMILRKYYTIKDCRVPVMASVPPLEITIHRNLEEKIDLCILMYNKFIDIQTAIDNAGTGIVDSDTDANVVHQDEVLKFLNNNDIIPLEIEVEDSDSNTIDEPKVFQTKYQVNEFKRHICHLKLGNNAVVMKMIEYAYYETLQLVKNFYDRVITNENEKLKLLAYQAQVQNDIKLQTRRHGLIMIQRLLTSQLRSMRSPIIVTTARDIDKLINNIENICSSNGVECPSAIQCGPTLAMDGRPTYQANWLRKKYNLTKLNILDGPFHWVLNATRKVNGFFKDIFLSSSIHFFRSSEKKKRLFINPSNPNHTIKEVRVMIQGWIFSAIKCLVHENANVENYTPTMQDVLLKIKNCAKNNALAASVYLYMLLWQIIFIMCDCENNEIGSFETFNKCKDMLAYVFASCNSYMYMRNYHEGKHQWMKMCSELRVAIEKHLFVFKTQHGKYVWRDLMVEITNKDARSMFGHRDRPHLTEQMHKVIGSYEHDGTLDNILHVRHRCHETVGGRKRGGKKGSRTSATDKYLIVVMAKSFTWAEGNALWKPCNERANSDEWAGVGLNVKLCVKCKLETASHGKSNTIKPKYCEQCANIVGDMVNLLADNGYNGSTRGQRSVHDNAKKKVPRILPGLFEIVSLGKERMATYWKAYYVDSDRPLKRSSETKLFKTVRTSQDADNDYYDFIARRNFATKVSTVDKFKLKGEKLFKAEDLLAQLIVWKQNEEVFLKAKSLYNEVCQCKTGMRKVILATTFCKVRKAIFKRDKTESYEAKQERLKAANAENVVPTLTDIVITHVNSAFKTAINNFFACDLFPSNNAIKNTTSGGGAVSIPGNIKDEPVEKPWHRFDVAGDGLCCVRAVSKLINYPFQGFVGHIEQYYTFISVKQNYKTCIFDKDECNFSYVDYENNGTRVRHDDAYIMNILEVTFTDYREKYKTFLADVKKLMQTRRWNHNSASVGQHFKDFITWSIQSRNNNVQPEVLVIDTTTTLFNIEFPATDEMIKEYVLKKNYVLQGSIPEKYTLAIDRGDLYILISDTTHWNCIYHIGLGEGVGSKDRN